MNPPRKFWIWVIPVLQISAGLAALQLNNHPFDGDELVSMHTAGSEHVGLHSLSEVWRTVTEEYTDQAYGMPLLYSFWGHLFGWSEFAIRLLPFFAGLLALSWTYRVGRDLFSPIVGIIASMLLMSSVFFITYMHVARPYAVVTLFVMITLWSYGRLAISPQAKGHDYAAQLGFLAGSIGLFYTHYYAVLLLVALFLWHLGFVPKDRRWRRPVLLLGVATVAFLPELRGLLRGFQLTQTAWHFTDSGMTRINEILPWFLYVLTNSVVKISGLLSIIALALAALMVLVAFWRFRQSEYFLSQYFLPTTTLIVLSLMLAGNEILFVLRKERLRYLMALWPMIATLTGWAIWQTRERWRWVATTLTGAWVVFGLWANTASELRYEFYELLQRHPVHIASKVVGKNAGAYDLLLFGDSLKFDHEYYFRPWPYERLEFRLIEDSQAEVSRTVHDHLRLWLLVDGADGEEYRAITANLPPELLFCERFVDRKNLVLELYTWSLVHCPKDEPAQMRFGEEIELAASEAAIVSEDTLRIDLLMQSEESTAMTAYSVALHVFDMASGAKVAQGDQGLWLGRYNPIRSEIDISGLETGEYEVKIGVYNWQTLERLNGVDLTNDAAANLLTLSRFQVE